MVFVLEGAPMITADVVALALTVVFGGAMVVVVVWDIATYEIPDTLSLMLVLVGSAALLAGQGWGGLGTHVLGALGAFAFGVVMFALGQWGGGDVKFLAATALWLSGPVLFGYILWVTIIGGGLALVVLVFRRFRLPECLAARPWLARLHQADEGLPYGVALGIGGLVMLRPAVITVMG